MQEVQARTRLLAPLTNARTVCRFTFQRRFVTLWAWLTLCPNCGPLPHKSQTLAISFNRNRWPAASANYSCLTQDEPEGGGSGCSGLIISMDERAWRPEP